MGLKYPLALGQNAFQYPAPIFFRLINYSINRRVSWKLILCWVEAMQRIIHLEHANTGLIRRRVILFGQ